MSVASESERRIFIMNRRHPICMIFVVFVAFSLVTGVTTAREVHTFDAARTTPFNHNQTTANNSSTSIHHENTPLVLDTAGNQTIRGETSLDPGTKLSVRVHATKTFFMSQSVAVYPNGTFAAVFNFTEYEPGTKFGVIVGLSRNNSSNIEPLAVVDGVLQNESEVIANRSTPTVTRTMTRTTTANESPKRNATNTTTTMQTTTETASTATGTTTTTRNPTGSNGQPGFGIAVALLALAAIGFVHRND